MKIRRSNSGVQSGCRKRAGGKRSSESAPVSKRLRRQPVEATEQQHSSHPYNRRYTGVCQGGCRSYALSARIGSRDKICCAAPGEECHVHGRFNESATAE